MKTVKDKENIEEENDFNVPSIPEPPKNKSTITIDSPGLSTSLLSRIKSLESEARKVVLVNCERCKEIIPIPVPKTIIENSEIPVVPVSYIHYNKDGKDQHCITLFLDHDFDIRRQRISDVIFPPEDKP